MDRRTFLSLLGFSALSFALPKSALSFSPKKKIKALWIYVGPIGDLGWTHAHDEGRKFVQKLFGDWLETRYIEKVSETEAKNVIELALLTEGYDAVFATSYGFMNAVKELAKRYPRVKFYHCSGPWEAFKDLPNVVTYFAEFYQLYYLNGVAGAAVTETCNLGYVPAFLIPEVIRHINAFTIGAIHGAKLMGKCNNGKDIKVYVTPPLEAWFAPSKAASSAQMLVDKYNVDVIAYTEDSTAILETAEKYWRRGKKVWSFSHYSNMYEYFLKKGIKLHAHLTGQIANWGPIYAYLLTKLYAGWFQKEDIWARLGDFVPIRWKKPWWESDAGKPEGAVYLAPLNPSIPKKALIYIKEKYEDMKELLFEPFTGPIYGFKIDSSGRPLEKPKLKVPSGVRLGRNDLWYINWLHEKTVPLSA